MSAKAWIPPSSRATTEAVLADPAFLPPPKLPQPPEPPAQGLQAWAGPVALGKTEALIQRVKAALAAGLPASRLTVWLASPDEGPRWQAALAPLPPLCGQAHLGTFSAWCQAELRANWPWLAEAGAPPLPPEGPGQLAGPMRAWLAQGALGLQGRAWEDDAWQALAQAMQAVDAWAGAWGQGLEVAVAQLQPAFASVDPETLHQALVAWRRWAWQSGHLKGGVAWQAFEHHLLPQPAYRKVLAHRAGLVVVDGASALPPIAWWVLKAWSEAGAAVLLAEDEPPLAAGWSAAGPWARAWWAGALRPPEALEGPGAWCEAAGRRWLLGELHQVPSPGGVHALPPADEGENPAWCQRLAGLLAEGVAPQDLAVVVPRWRPSWAARLNALKLPWAWCGATEPCLHQGPMRALWLLWLARWVPEHPAVAEAAASPMAEAYGEAAAQSWWAFAEKGLAAQAQASPEALPPALQGWWGAADERPSATWRRFAARLWGTVVAEALEGRTGLATWPEGLADALGAYRTLLQDLEAWEATWGHEAPSSGRWGAWAAQQEVLGPKMAAPDASGKIRVGPWGAIAKLWPRPKVVVVAEASHPRFGPQPSPLAWWRAHQEGRSLPQQTADRWCRLGQLAPRLECFPGQGATEGEPTTGPFAAALALSHANPLLDPAWVHPQAAPAPLRSPRRLSPRAGQQAFLAHRGGHAAVLAVPGAGKSTSVVAYVVGLLEAGVVPPWGVELITHTRVAAKHLSHSLDAALQEAGLPAGGVQVGTVHALARRLLQMAPPGALPLPIGRHRLDDLDERWKRLWWRAWEAQAGPRRGQAEWEHAFQRCEALTQGHDKTTAELLVESAQALWKAAWAEGRAGLARLEAEAEAKPMGAGVAWRFESLRRAAEVHSPELDLGLALLLVERRPEVAAAWRGPLRVVLEDEAQDTSPLQLALLQALTAEGCWWLRVGDPNQSIYGFTGAQPSALLAHAEAHPCYRLEEASRSSPAIANLANDWVRQHIRRTPQGRRPPLHAAQIQCSQDAPPDEAIPLRFLPRFSRHRDVFLEELLARWPRKAAHERWAVIAPYNTMVNRLIGSLSKAGIPVHSGRGDLGHQQAHQLMGEAWRAWWAADESLAGPEAWLGPWAKLLQGDALGHEHLEALDFWAEWWRGQGPTTWAELPHALDELLTTRALAEAIAKQQGQALPTKPRQLAVLNLHGAKGLEFDRVWLLGWDFYGKRPQQHNPLKAWALARWREGSSATPQEASEAAQLDDLHERIRQAYVGLSRARLELVLGDVPHPDEDPIAAAWRGLAP